MGDVTSATSTTGLWPAPTSTGLNATVAVPGSKSQTNRALVLAAQADAAVARSPGHCAAGTPI